MYITLGDGKRKEKMLQEQEKNDNVFCSLQLQGCSKSGEMSDCPLPALPGVSSAGGHPAGAATTTRQSPQPNLCKKAKFNVLVMGPIFILDTFVIKSSELSPTVTLHE